MATGEPIGHLIRALHSQTGFHESNDPRVKSVQDPAICPAALRPLPMVCTSQIAEMAKLYRRKMMESFRRWLPHGFATFASLVSRALLAASA